MSIEMKAILSPKRTLCRVDCGSKKRALETIANHIANDCPVLDTDHLFTALLSREKLGSTGIGKGIAIPHCRIKHCAETTIGMLVTLKAPVDFMAIDNQKVDILFALLAPENANAAHLEILSMLAQKFSQESFVASLRHATSHDALYQVVTQ
jgi:nitrogen PTS system EIIA component